ncbi:MAG: DUF3857 domain-containing protein [Bacteroidales bacterium]|nr:DUF3857 domain-containing protein [Bacteroidales bacterium]MBN2818743.1 DUF3857 domain-containing protein [Bacteroidales bacterium]
MKRLSNSLLISTFLLFFSSITYCQKLPFKVGNVDMADMIMKRHPVDTNAGAVVLCDFGITRFNYTVQSGFTITFSRQTRIKIFSKDRLDEGDFIIPLYVSSQSSDKEDIGKIRAYSYNLEEGKIVKTKLEFKDIYTEEVNENWVHKKFSVPNVREGSVIDIEYQIDSPFLFNLQSWYFQDDIPTVFSKYHVFIPEWFNYKNWVQGYINVNRSTSSRETRYTYRVDAIVLGGSYKSGENRDFEINTVEYIYEANNVPAFITEPYMTTKKDYISAVKFEIQWTQFPRSPIKHYTTTWEKINIDLLEHSDFGKRLKGSRGITEIAESITKNTVEPLVLMQNAFQEIKKRISWNGLYRIYVYDNLNAVLDAKSGSSSDINLSLIALCRELGLDANPVLISTRDNGLVRPAQVILSQFNHVIACVTIDGQNYLLDATDENTPFPLLSPNSLNRTGWLVKEKGDWIDLRSENYYFEFYYGNFELDENLTFNGIFQYQTKDYASREIRKKINSTDGEKDFVREFEQKNAVTFSDYTLENLDNEDKSVTFKANVTIEDYIVDGGDRLYFNPLILGRIEKNPFTDKDRLYPVDFNYWSQKRCIYSIKIPEGYTIEEMPEKIRINLPDNKGSFTYIISNVGNIIQVNSEYKRTETLYTGESYQHLNQFYEMMIGKEGEQIVLKKSEKL